MLKTLMAQIKEYKKDSLKTPAYMILEVIMETFNTVTYGIDCRQWCRKRRYLSHLQNGSDHGRYGSHRSVCRYDGWKIRGKGIGRIRKESEERHV